MSFTNFQLSLSGATWVDTNSLVTLNNMPDRIPDDYAIQNSIYNLCNCHIGGRGRIFEPTYGSMWLYLLQEPPSDMTAARLRIAAIQMFGKWEPRVALNYGQTYVAYDSTLPGYQVQIAGTVTLTKVPFVATFTEAL